jgi:hypothetical protein
LKKFRIYGIIIFLLNIILCTAGYFLVKKFALKVTWNDIVILSSLFSSISLLQLFIFFRGMNKESDSSVMHTLVSVSSKFLLDIILALVWFIVIKKTENHSVFLFFVLYLTLTLFSTFIILKTLKDKSLYKGAQI